MLVIEQSVVVHISLEMGCTIFPNLQKPCGEVAAAFATNPPQTFPHCLGHGLRHAFTGRFREFSSQRVRFLVLNIQTHMDILPWY